MKGSLKGLILAIGAVVGVFLCVCVVLAGLWLFDFQLLSPPPPPEEEASPAWSPDGQRIAFECYIEGPTQPVTDSDQRQYSSAAADICVAHVDGSHRIRLTANQVADEDPTWSPDGAQIAYTSEDGIYLIDSDGNNQRLVVHIPPKAGTDYMPEGVAWSPDSRFLAFSACLEQNRDIYVVEVGSGVLTNLTTGDASRDMKPAWLPNSKEIAFLSSPPLANDSCTQSVTVLTSRLRLISIDESNERDIYGDAFLFTLSVSPAGQIAFVANLRAKNDMDLTFFPEHTQLYTMWPDQEEPTSWSEMQGSCIWAPDSQHLVCNYHVLNVRTGDKHGLPSGVDYDPFFSWSPDSRKLATTGYQEIGNIFARRVVIIDLKTGAVHSLIQHKEPAWP